MDKNANVFVGVKSQWPQKLDIPDSTPVPALMYGPGVYGDV